MIILCAAADMEVFYRALKLHTQNIVSFRFRISAKYNILCMLGSSQYVTEHTHT